MGSVPVAQPSPPGRIRISRRAVGLILLLVGAGGVLVLGVIFAWPTDPAVSHQWVEVGRIEDFEVARPVTFPQYRFSLVRLGEDEFVALYRKDPHLGCTVPFRPEFTFLGRKGWFRNPCHGETYDLRGVCYSGPCARGLDRFPLRIKGDRLQVNVPGEGKRALEHFEEEVLIPGPGADFEGGYGQPVNPPQGTPR